MTHARLAIRRFFALHPSLLLQLALLVATMLVTRLALAIDAPPTDVSSFADQLSKAIGSHSWVLAAALVIWGIVAVAKQGWFGAWVSTHLPARAVPFVAMGLGVLGTATAEIIGGAALRQALIDSLSGIAPAVLAIVGHELGIESLRDGKEVVPQAPWIKAATPPAKV